MFNLLRMDLYRLIRCKFVYVCFAILVMILFVCYGIIYLSAIPDGRQIAEKMGMVLTTAEAGQVLEALRNMDTLSLMREASMDGGSYSVIYGIAVALFVCGDFKGGFIKNIMALHKIRWKYIGSKLMAAGVLNFLYLVLQYGVGLLLNRLFHNMARVTQWEDALFYLGWTWLLMTAFAALIIMVCVLAGSSTAGVCAAIFLGSGLIVVAVASIMSYFRLDGWLQYTIYYNTAYGPSAYSAAGDLKVFAVGLVFLVLYTLAAAVFLTKRDI